MDGMTDKQQELFTVALERFDNAVSFEKENRELAEEDHSFANGDGQWEEHIKEQRIKQRRPYLTINRLMQDRTSQPSKLARLMMILIRTWLSC